MAVQILIYFEGGGKADDTDKGRFLEFPSALGRTRCHSEAHGRGTVASVFIIRLVGPTHSLTRHKSIWDSGALNSK